MKLDGVNHEFPCTPDAGLHLWVEVVGDVGDVDGQLVTYGVDADMPSMTGGTGGDNAHGCR
jgi:hypothetical protein